MKAIAAKLRLTDFGFTLSAESNRIVARVNTFSPLSVSYKHEPNAQISHSTKLRFHAIRAVRQQTSFP